MAEPRCTATVLQPGRQAPRRARPLRFPDALAEASVGVIGCAMDECAIMPRTTSGYSPFVRRVVAGGRGGKAEPVEQRSGPVRRSSWRVLGVQDRLRRDRSPVSGCRLNARVARTPRARVAESLRDLPCGGRLGLRNPLGPGRWSPVTSSPPEWLQESSFGFP